MGGWRFGTHGAWLRWAASVALMGLLAVIAAITALATASSFPDFPGRAVAYVSLYIFLIMAICAIGWSIFREQRRKRP